MGVAELFVSGEVPGECGWAGVGRPGATGSQACAGDQGPCKPCLGGAPGCLHRGLTGVSWG